MSYQHIKSARITVFNNVYPPSDDTIQTLNALDYVIEVICRRESIRRRRFVIADVGCGTGILTVHAILKSLSLGIKPVAISTDVNPHAVKNAVENLNVNRLQEYADVVQTSTLRSFRRASITILVSNPPYLPSAEADEMLQHDWIIMSVIGGKSGREVIDEILNMIELNRPDVVVLTQSSLSDVSRTLLRLKSLGYDVVVSQRSHFLFEDVTTLIAFALKRDHSMVTLRSSA